MWLESVNKKKEMKSELFLRKNNAHLLIYLLPVDALLCVESWGEKIVDYLPLITVAL